MYTLLPAAALLFTMSGASVQIEPVDPIGPLAQSFYPAEDDDRPELFLPKAGDSDPSNFEPVDGDSDTDNYESPDLDELALPAQSFGRAQA
jgi:hypothetical protein